jgi:hypothetical protein
MLLYADLYADNMSRKLLVRGVSVRDEPVGRTGSAVVEADEYDTLFDVFNQTDIEARMLLSCVTLLHAREPLLEGTRWTNLDQTLAELDEVCLTLGLAKASVLVFTVGSREAAAEPGPRTGSAAEDGQRNAHTVLLTLGC